MNIISCPHLVSCTISPQRKVLLACLVSICVYPFFVLTLSTNINIVPLQLSGLSLVGCMDTQVGQTMVLEKQEAKGRQMRSEKTQCFSKMGARRMGVALGMALEAMQQNIQVGMRC